jgi:hypothetical protein
MQFAGAVLQGTHPPAAAFRYPEPAEIPGVKSETVTDESVVPSSISNRDPESVDREFHALQAVVSALQSLDSEARQRIFVTAATFLRLDMPAQTPFDRSTSQRDTSVSSPKYPPFSADMSLTSKEFLLQKQPRTDVERVAVLAYYLTHYRDMPKFTTLDISKLNTEAGQPKFSNAANSVNNAVTRRYLISASKGQRQLSAAGEQFVTALPDRDAARAAMAAASPRRPARKRASSPRPPANKPAPSS